MDVGTVKRTADLPGLGRAAHAFMADVFPLCRSISGEGLRETLRKVAAVAPLRLTEVPTGTVAFDWTVPREWNIRDAWVADASGRRVIDFRTSNLHVVNYSVPVRARMALDDLRSRLYTLPDHPTWVPYRTSYYKEDWGFCLTQEVLDQLPPGDYEAVIDATLTDGSLTYGECLLPGASDEEILVSSHACHPSLANDNLSGVAVAAQLAAQLAGAERRYTWRFLFAPGTIGAIVWLARNMAHAARIRAGLVLACVGDPGPLLYKRSRRGDTEVDHAVAHVLASRGRGEEVVPFSPNGNDERQFCSPGFDLPVGAITRSGHDRGERHHTSADDLEWVTPEALADSIGVCLSVAEILEGNAVVTSLNPMCEPQLGRRGLYRTSGGRVDQADVESAFLWILSSGDGNHTLLDVAERAGLPFTGVLVAAQTLAAAGLLDLGPVPYGKREIHEGGVR